MTGPVSPENDDRTVRMFVGCVGAFRFQRPTGTPIADLAGGIFRQVRVREDEIAAQLDQMRGFNLLGR